MNFKNNKTIMKKFNHVDSIFKIACCLNHILEAYHYVNDFEDFKTIVDEEYERLCYIENIWSHNGHLKDTISAFVTVKRDYGKDEFSGNLLDAWNKIKAIVYPWGSDCEGETKKGYLETLVSHAPFIELFNSKIK